MLLPAPGRFSTTTGWPRRSDSRCPTRRATMSGVSPAPAAVIDKLNSALNEGLKSPELQASLAKLGLQTKSMTPREFAAKLADEARDWEAAVTESGVKID